MLLPVLCFWAGCTSLDRDYWRDHIVSSEVRRKSVVRIAEFSVRNCTDKVPLDSLEGASQPPFDVLN
ncbi:MAG TPA: hypothetical protein VK633_07030 [Verrucomicrobiae bacterium]|nr:hypothetical protein [Verrucomicrobiae bacterium]